jgi:tRNA-dihydrouridine synthase B
MVYSNFLAPIDEYTNLPFRLLCQKYGAKATCVPLVNSTAISRKPEKLDDMDAHRDEQDVGIQLVGNKPEDIDKTSKIIAEKMPYVKWLNLNCGCPSTKTRESGGGSALLDQPEVIEQAVSEMKKYHDNVSVKIRLKPSLDETVKLCKKIENAGANFLIVHGRTVKQGYSGKCNWEAIRVIKEKVGIPVAGNGDIQTVEHGKILVERGYCDSFMIGRAAMANPMVFSGRIPNLDDRKEIFAEYLELSRRYLAKENLGDIRVKTVNFVNSVPNAAELRNRICRAKTIKIIMELIEGLHAP